MQMNYMLKGSRHRHGLSGASITTRRFTAPWVTVDDQGRSGIPRLAILE